MIYKRKNQFSLICLVVLALAACSPTGEPLAPSQGMEQATQDEMQAMDAMGVQQTTDQFAPLVRGFYEGGEMLFVHTEASDEGVAEMLTEMMAGPLVVLVPELAQAPEALLAQVYVFTNGVEGAGPFGFQPDIFDSVPGDAEYRPLRAVNLVSWEEGASPRELRSLEELQAAEAAGELTTTQAGIVVNMPVLVWPGGHR